MSSIGMTFLWSAIIAAAGAGCTRKSASAVGDGSARGDSGAAKAGECDLAPLGLASATQVPTWKAPAGCSFNAGGDARGPIRSEEEFRAAFTCTGTAASSIDFAQHQLVVQSRTLSPAAIGGLIVDDGTKVTYVERFREPCPSEYPPMPVPYQVMFLLPADATREFAEASCNVHGTSHCR